MKLVHFVFVLAGITINGITSSAGEIRTVALSGQQMPGLPPGMVFGSFLFPRSPVVLSDAGQTAFYTGGRVWSEGGGSLQLVAAFGQQAPGLPDGTTYTGFAGNERIAISGTGTMAFAARVAPSPVNDVGFWSIGPGTSALVARGGEQAAGLPAGVVYSFGSTPQTSFVINDAGHAAFLGGARRQRRGLQQ